MAYNFDDAIAAERHETQYFEMMCNRGIYHQGWTAVTQHRTPWEFSGQPRTIDDDVWELYDNTTDWTQAHDLAAEHPDKLAELQRLFEIEATKYNVLPLDPRFAERFNAELAGRPILGGGQHAAAVWRHAPPPGKRGHQHQEQVALRHGRDRGSRAAAPGRDHRPRAAASGGWSLYVHEGKLRYGYNFAGAQLLLRRWRYRRCQPARTRCGWSSPTTVAGSARAATSCSTSTAPSRLGPR